ncbi:MAG TPA: aldo/keto reductase [Thermoleophilaceae bacterium]|nr:aldo/keto reductase [Thermoleophilaceae bacterium]
MPQQLTDSSPGTFRLGDHTVRRLGFGAMRITGDGVWGEPEDRNESLAVLRRAVERGVNLIDTADSYGPNVSEELIAEALHPYPDDLLIATKAGFVRDGPGRWRTHGHPDHLREAVEGSLRRLKLDRIELLQLHRIDDQVPAGDQLGALAELRDEGKIAHIGLSEVSVEQLEHAEGITPIVSVQNRFNLEDRAAEDVLEACERRGIGFIPWFPLGSGNLLREGSPLEEIAERHGASPAQIALAWLLARSEVMLPIPGTSSVEHLEDNLAAAEIDLTDEEVQALEDAA